MNFYFCFGQNSVLPMLKAKRLLRMVCVTGHVSRGQLQPRIWNPDPYLPLQYTTYTGSDEKMGV